LPLVVVEGGGVDLAGHALRLEGVHVELTPEPAGEAWAVEGRAALGTGACSVGGRLVPRGGRRVRMEVQCDTAITWPLGVAELAVRFKALSVDAAAGGGGRLEASLEEGSLLRLPVGAEAEVTLLTGGGVVRTSAPGRARIDAQVRPGSGAGRLSLRGELLGEGPAAILEVGIERFDLGETPLTKLLPVEVLAGGVSGDVAVDLLEGLGRADVSGEVSVDGLELHHPWLAEEPVGGLGAVLELDIAVDLRQRLVEVFRNVWTVNGLPVEVDGRAKLTPPIRVVGSVRSGPHEGDVLAKAIPKALIPALSPLELRGPWTAQARVDVDVAMPKDLALEVDLDVDELEVVRMGDVRPESVLGTFRRRYRDPDTDESKGFDTGPSTADWTPLERIPPSLLIGLRVQEDGGFFKHEGFSLLHVKGALRRDIQEGRLARGASTISMQTVKNVFLTLDKTLSRKLQEVFITWQMERVLDKPDILETYVNVIEWGPRIFGIAHAARHYFAKVPADLSPLECVYLSTVVPGPRLYHVDFALGRIGRKHRRRIQRTMALMVRRGHLSPEEFSEAEAAGFSPELAPFVPDKVVTPRGKPPASAPDLAPQAPPGDRSDAP